MKTKVLITTGGSGGHVIPALTFYEHLRNDFDVFLSSDLRGSKFISSELNNFKIINILPLTRNIFSLPWNIFLFIFAIIKSLIYIKKKELKLLYRLVATCPYQFVLQPKY